MSKSPAVSSLLIALASVSLYAQVHLGSVYVGSKTTETVTVTVTARGELATVSVVTGGTQHLDFTDAGGGTCKPGVTYALNATCTVRVQFMPQLTGARLGGISLADANGNPMATAYLNGTGLGPQISFLPATQIAVLGGLNNVAALSVDPSKNVYVAESETLPDFPGAPEIPGSLIKATYTGNGDYSFENISGSLVDPVGVAVDGDGNVLEADAVVEPWIGPQQANSFAMPGYFHEEKSIAVDAEGNIYSAGEGSVYKSSPAFAPIQTYSTVVSGLGNIRSIAVDGQGNLYIPDSGSNPAVYKETLTESGYTQTKIGAGWVQPVGIAVDANGIVYVNDSGTVYAETLQPNGTYVGTAVLAGQNHGTSPAGLAVDGDGGLYVPVYGGPGPFGSSFDVYKFDRSAPPTLSFAATKVESTSLDSPRTVTISNLGNSPLQFTAVNYPADFPEATGSGNRCSEHTRLAVGASCDIVVQFTPVSIRTREGSSVDILENVDIVTDSLNAPAEVQHIPLSGTAIHQPAAQAPALLP